MWAASVEMETEGCDYFLLLRAYLVTFTILYPVLFLVVQEGSL